MRIKSYVFYVERPDGVLVRGAGRSFVITGAKAYAAVARLFALFDGRYSRAQITAGLPETVRPLFEQLVAELEANHFLASDEAVGAEIDATTRHTFADVLAYLSDWHPTPERAFGRWRATRVAVVGTGTLAAAAVATLATLGQSHIVDRKGADSAPVDLILVVHDTAPDNAMLVEQVRALDPADVTVLVAFGRAGAVQVGPLVRSRATGLREVLGRIAVPPEGPTRSSDSCLRIAGSLIALEALNHIANLEPGAACARDMSLEDKMFRVSPLGLVERHVIPDAYFDDGDASQSEPVWSMECDAAKGIYDPVTGILEVDHGHVDRQMPLHMFGLAAHLPTPTHRERIVADGWGLAEEDACYRAHLAVIARYTREAATDLREAPIAVCRQPDRLRSAKRAWALTAGHALQRREPVAGHEIMLIRLMAILSGKRPELFELIPESGFAVVEVRFADEAYRCVGETSDAAAIEILGALTAALQAGWPGDGKASGIPVLAALPGAVANGMRVGGRTGDARIDPVWSRLGWEVATLAEPVEAVCA